MANLVFADNSNNWHCVDFPNLALTQVSWDTSPDTPLAYVFFGHVNVDFDGSPTAYGPPGISPPPDDDLGNAGNDDQGWFGLLALSPNDPLVLNGSVTIDTNPAMNKKGKFPVVQRAENGDPSPGYYVSTSPHANGPIYLQSSYIDASQIAFGALSGRLAALGFSLGDYGLAIRHDQNLQSGFYFVDTGANTYALGECSHKVGKNLGGSGRAAHFNNNYPVSFIVFPGTFTIDPSAPPSIPDDQIKTALQPLLAKLSTADNAADLALLMGFNETNPPNRPQGTSKLAAYKSKPGSQLPTNASTLLGSLQAFGYSASVTLASNDAANVTDSSTSVASADETTRSTDGDAFRSDNSSAKPDAGSA